MMFLYDLLGTPFGWVMKVIYDLVKNYGVAILLFTIFTKILLFPISYKQQKNTIKTQSLSPKLEKLKKKYKDDPQKLQQAQMQLYQDENVNPSASCLPMFLQFFILFGVLDVVYKPLTHILRYSKNVVSSAVTILQDKFPEIAKQGTGLREELGVMSAFRENPSAFDNISGFDTSQVSEFLDKFSLFGVNLGVTPDFKPDVWDRASIILWLIPILSGVIQLVMTIYMQIVQKKRNPSMPSMGCANVMLYFMPIFSIWFAYQVPAGVGFYWICSSLFSLIQTIGLNLYFTPERSAKILEKENEKMKKKYANGKKSFTQRMLEQNNAMQQDSASAKRARYDDDIKDMSKQELSAYNRQILNEARKRMAEKYGESVPDDDDKTNNKTNKK
ncbi:MAG: YidC/Oxa1 family membrane protein insertase [Ruminococcus sp.]|nr:YidC/Oxa1 family membrane protein insertase [Ruminococcus sp.]